RREDARIRYPHSVGAPGGSRKAPVHAPAAWIAVCRAEPACSMLCAMNDRNRSKPKTSGPPAPPPVRARPLRPTPIISRVLADGTQIEALHDAARGTTQLAICAPSGKIALAPHYDLPSGERLIAYS